MTRSTRSKPKSGPSSKAATKRQGRSAKESKRRTKPKWQELPSQDEWADWVKYLAARRRPLDLADLLPHAATHPLKWALPDDYAAHDQAKLLKQLVRLSAGKKYAAAQVISLAADWLQEVPRQEPDHLSALHALAWCHALPRLAQIVPESTWRELLEQLQVITESAAGINLHEQPVAHQLLNGELPLALAYTFPELVAFKRLRDPATASLSHGIVELLDGEGLPNARHMDKLRALLACWTRCCLISGPKHDAFTPEGHEQFEWLTRQALRTSRPDGTLILSQGLSGDWCEDLFRAALREERDKGDRTVAKLILPGKGQEVTDRQRHRLPEPSVYSEWSEACVMRSSWSRRSPQFSCLFNDCRLRSELTAGGRLLWSGDSEPRLRVDGSELAKRSDWTELCWFTDDDVDYLELEAEYEGDWMVQRQMLLARSDDVLFLADAILGPRVADVQYDLVLPLADDVRFEPQGATREGALVNSRPLCTVIPLSLPEWMVAPARGQLETERNHLHLRVHDSIQRLYAPLFFDLGPRLARKRTWRQLTVAERLEALTRDVAVGYRVQLGKRQWLIYRSLAHRCNRSVLGQNLAQEFVMARFDLDGCLEELIEIE